MKESSKRRLVHKAILIVALIILISGVLAACELKEPSTDTLFYINDSLNSKNLHDTDKDGAIDNVTTGIDNLRGYVKDATIATTGYYMGTQFNITTYKKPNNTPSAFTLNVRAHLYTNDYLDENGHRTYQFKKDKGTYENTKYNGFYYNVDLGAYKYYDDLFSKEPTTETGAVISGESKSYYYDKTVVITKAEFVVGRDYLDTSTNTYYQRVNPLTDDSGSVTIYYKDAASGSYIDVSTVEGKTFVDSEVIHNEVIKKSDIEIEWIDQSNNMVLIGLYFDGINNNSEDNGNILYVDIQGSKRSFADFGDTVTYRQLIRLLMSLSVENLLTSANLQGDAGTGSLKTLFDVAVTDNYKVVYNGDETSTLFYGVSADLLAANITETIQNLFAPFQNKVDPLTLRYLGFKFSVMGIATINSITSDMQFFTQAPENNDNAGKILSGAYLTFAGAAMSGTGLYSYDADATFDYGAYPPEPIVVANKDYYKPYEYGNYEFVGNLYIPAIESNFDALIRTDMQQYDNAKNNVFMEFRDIANGELMIGAYYRNERTYVDISGMEYLYGAVALEELGFPKVYDERLNLAEALGSFYNFMNNTIIGIVDGILSPKKDDTENKLLKYIMDKTTSTEKDPNDPFTKNTVTVTVDMELIKNALRETGVGEFTTRDVINILDSMSPYTMDQIATILGISSAEVMLDNTYFTVTIIINDKGKPNDITIKMFTNVGVKPGDPSIMLFQLDLTPTHVGEKVKIADIDFTDFKPLEQIYTYSATMSGSFIFSTAETVDMSKLLSATIGENSGLNTFYVLPKTAGISFNLIYDQYVTDQTVDGVLKKAGRSSFTLSVYLTGDEGTIIIELSSDDVAFNNQVYKGLPATADQLGYVWVNIACIYEGKERKIPKIKVREDIFMSSMQAYMQGTAISDNVSNLGASDVNLSITSILMALVKDSYVVLQPKQIEITTSNETVQNLFRVKSLIGNIKFDAGFRYRVKGLESVKADYGLYQVGYFDDMEEYSPYETVLHDKVGIYFYDDYHTVYDEFKYDFRLAKEKGNKLQVYKKGGKVTINREAITYAGDTFFTSENASNQDVNLVRFLFSTSVAGKDNKFVTINSALGKIVYKKDDGKYYYTDYAGEEKVIPSQYIKSNTEYTYDMSGNTVLTTISVYIYYKGLQDIVSYEGDASYYFYDKEKAELNEAQNGYVYIDLKQNRDFLFQYDDKSIQVTDAAKTQYAPRINGSFMGATRRYILTITSPYAVDRGDVVSLSNTTYYSQEDKDNVVAIYNEDGIKISETAVPIPLFVMEPCEDLADRADVQVAVKGLIEAYNQPCRFVIDWDNITLKGDMVLTDVIIAEGTMGERVFPVRIIVNNREIISEVKGGTNIYVNERDELTENVPVVDSIEIDPYDYVLAKYRYFLDTNNYNPNNYSMTQYLIEYALKEKDFVNEFFKGYEFNIMFDYESSRLVALNVKDEYVQKEYTNKKTITVGNTVTVSMTEFNWDLDAYAGATNNIEKNINPKGNTIYLHTYFYGQLISLRVYVGERTFAYLRFGESDTFSDKNVVGSVQPNGHYIANYFDESSYEVDKHPIFVFVDDRGRLYEKVFDMDYIYDIDSNGNYLIKQYGTGWADPTITNIGSKGSYYKDKDGNIVNRPFYISNVIRDENGSVISEELPTPTANASDITTATLDLRYIMAIFKSNSGKKERINMITGDSNSEWFSTVVLRVKVECPKQPVDTVKLTGGAEVEESDNANGDLIFTPSAIQIGNNPIGYYQIDPLNADTLIIPTTAKMFFADADGNRLPVGHTFKNIKWLNWQATGGIGKDVIEYDSVKGQYKFLLSTSEPLTTRITALIGNDVAGYESVTLCIKVLSKDPKNIEFFTGAEENDANRIAGIEKVSLTVDTSVNDGGIVTASDEKFVSYTYYVDTFADFAQPRYLLATFGTENNSRKVMYPVTWTTVSDNESPAYNPNKVVCLKTTIGDSDEVKVTVYLNVVVANYTLARVEMLNAYLNNYVKVKDKATGAYSYKKISELFNQDLTNQKIGYGSLEGESIAVSLGREEDNGVSIGKVGLFVDNGGQKTLVKQLYPYELVQELYSKANIIFNKVGLVDIWGGINSDYYNSYVYLDSGATAKLSSLAKVTYGYDASTSTYTSKIVFISNNGNYIKIESDKSVLIYPNSYMSASDAVRVNIIELANLVNFMTVSEELDGLTVTSVTSEGTVTPINRVLKDMYSYRSGAVSYYNPNTVTDNLVFSSITFANGVTMSYEELGYRLVFLNKHRIQGYTPAAINGKDISIDNLDGLFSINDVVINTQDGSFALSDKYRIILGTGSGSYDLKTAIVFADGLRISAESAGIKEMYINAYSNAGVAQYGENGYILGDNVSANVVAVKQDGTGNTITYEYGGVKTKLVDWYVEYSDYAQIKVGSYISVIPQTVIYANSDGILRLCSLTEEGFRLVRTFHFNGVSDDINSFDSVGNTELKIYGGTITVDNVYDFVQKKQTLYKTVYETQTDPQTGEQIIVGSKDYYYYYNDLATYFSNVLNLPKTIELSTGAQNIRITNVPWTLERSWYYTTVESDGKPVEHGTLADMDYTGTYNKGTDSTDPRLIATAQILGWTSVEGGKIVSHDKVNIRLFIKIETAEAVSLPWKETSPYLDTTKITERVTVGGIQTDRDVFLVDVDAFNNATSGVISGTNVKLPEDIKIKYASGLTNLFNGVKYTYLNTYAITAIPYNLQGIDTVALAETLGVDEATLSKENIDLQIDLGLGQKITLRFRFYDKRVQKITAVIDYTDSTVRSRIASMFDLTGYASDIMDNFNRTRIIYNTQSLIKAVDEMNNAVLPPKASELKGKDEAEVKAILYRVINALDVSFAGEFPTTTAFNAVQCRKYAYNRLSGIFNTAYTTVYKTSLMNALNNIAGGQATEEQADAIITELFEVSFSKGYETVINDYIEGELARVLVKDLSSYSNAELNNAFDYKNRIEAGVNVESIIKETAMLREQYVLGNIKTESALNTAIQNVFKKYIAAAITKARTVYPLATQYEYCKRVEKIFLSQIGYATYEGYDYGVLSGYNIATFAANYGLSGTKTEMRKAINEIIAKCMNYNYNYSDILSDYIAYNYDNTANIAGSVMLIKNNVLNGISIDVAVNSMLEKVVKNYVDTIYVELTVVNAAKRAIAINGESGVYYIDPYYDYMYVPTKIIADYDENKGGYSHVFNVIWNGDSVSNNVTYKGNAKEDYVADIGAVDALYKEVGSPENGNATAKEYIEGLLADEMGNLTTWDDLINDQIGIYNTLAGIYNLVTAYYTVPDNYTEEQTAAFKKEKALILYTYYRVGEKLLATESGTLDARGISKADFIRKFEGLKYNELTSTLHLNTTGEDQRISLLVKVFDRSVDSGEIQLRIDGEGQNYTSFTISDPFATTLDDLPNTVVLNGTVFPVVWKDVTITPSGNLGATNKTVYGNVKNAKGQEVSLDLIVYSWEYLSTRKQVTVNGSPEWRLMNPINIYVSDYLDYSATDYYMMTFKVTAADKSTKVESRIFYPEDSILLVNSTNDADMATVAEYRKYLLYWDSDAVKSAKNGANITNGSLSIGNAVTGKFDISTLTTDAKAVVKANYYYENMNLDGINMSTGLNEEDPLYEGIADALYGSKNISSVVVDVDGILPSQGDVKLFENYVHYNLNDITVRLLWNKTYEKALSALTAFVKFKQDVSDAEAAEQALAILLNTNRSAKEETKLIAEAKEYMAFFNDLKGNAKDEYLASEKSNADAYELLMINEKYDFAANANNLKGGMDSTRSVTVVIKVGNSAKIFTKKYSVRMIFTDLTPLAYSKDGDMGGSNLVQTIGATVTKIDKLFIGVRTKYWDGANGVSQYATDGIIPRYDTTDGFVYKLLQVYSNAWAQSAGLKSIEVTDIVLGDAVNSYKESVSFKINGVQYNSSLIRLRVSGD